MIVRGGPQGGNVWIPWSDLEMSYMSPGLEGAANAKVKKIGPPRRNPAEALRMQDVKMTVQVARRENVGHETVVYFSSCVMLYK